MGRITECYNLFAVAKGEKMETHYSMDEADAFYQAIRVLIEQGCFVSAGIKVDYIKEE